MNNLKKRWKKRRSVRGAILVGVCLSILIGTDRGWPVSSSVVPVSIPAGSVKTAQGVRVFDRYHPFGKSDPFEPFWEKEVGRKKLRSAQKVKPLSIFPLQRAGIGQFRLIGIAGNEQSRTAMVADAGGKFFPLSVGTEIGLNGGRVVEILEDRVLIEEKAAAGKGRHKTKYISLKLPRGDE